MPTGIIKKMQTQWINAQTPLAYTLPIGPELLSLNPLIGQNLSLTWTGKIFCIHCGRETKKSFSQGYCYPCTMKLAQTDFCLLKPETCHHHLGTCRDNDFAQTHCFIPHSVYLANSSAIKVGITRSHQKLNRWADQGATQALEIAVVPNRKISGELEVLLAKKIADKTNWRKMLSLEIPHLDLINIKEGLVKDLPEDFQKYLVHSEVQELTYPVQKFPAKIASHNLEKTPELSGKLMGIKGQYLIFEDTVINLRKYQGHEISLL